MKLNQSGQWKVGLGGFLEGLQGGLKSAEESRRQREEMENRKKELDLRLKLFDMQQQEYQTKLKKALTEQGALESLAQQVGGETVTPTEGPATEQGVGPAPVITPSTDPEKRLKAAMVRGGLAKQALTPSLSDMMKELQGFQGGAGADQYDLSISPTGPRLTPKREAVGNVSRLGQIQEKVFKGTASDAEKAYLESQMGQGSIIAQTSRQRAEQGVLGRGTPEALQSQTAQEAAKAAGRPVEGAIQTQMSALETLLTNTIPNIEKNLKSSYLGPVKGTDIGFEARRRFGSIAGAPLASGETTFRQALKDAGDQLLRARSGAQINEQEYARLAGLLPKATDEPAVFTEGLQRFKQEMQTILRAKQKFAVTPRGQLGGQERPTLPPPPAGWR